MKQNIGQLLYYNEQAFLQEQQAWENSVFPTVKPVIDKFNALGIGEFNNIVFNQFKAGDFASIHEKAHAGLKEDFKGFRLQRLQEEARHMLNEQLAELEQAWMEVDQKRNNASFMAFNSLNLSWADVRFEDGMFRLNTEAMQERHKVYVENEDQATLYQYLLDVKKAHDKVISYLTEKGVDRRRYLVISHEGSALINSDHDKNTSIRPRALSVLQLAEANKVDNSTKIKEMSAYEEKISA